MKTLPFFAPWWQWLGLTPRANSSGGKERLGGITKQGDGYLRRLLVVGATAVMRMARKNAARQPWMAQLLERKPAKIATVALANKTARIAWAVMSRTRRLHEGTRSFLFLHHQQGRVPLALTLIEP